MSHDFYPTVSIVIPVYNGSNFLAQAIDSALAQSYKNLEIIVVNDGSCDDGATECIALGYGDKIRYFSKPNGGVSSALNFGIEKMRGEYFSWLSHDDLYASDKVSREVEALASCRDKANTVVCCADNLVDTDGNIIFHPAKRLSGVYSGADLFDIFFTRHLNINGCTLLISRVLFERYGGFSKFRYIQDTECWVKFMLGGVTFKFIPDKLVMMRVHPGQVTQRMPELFHVEMAEFCWNIINDYISAGRMSPENIRSFLIYNYKNRMSAIYRQIEAEVGNVMPVKKYYYILYGMAFDAARKIYTIIFKK